MSSVKDFFQFVDSNEAISKEYDSLDNRPSVLAFAKKHGFTFSEEDFVAHFENSDLNLDNISGGSQVEGQHYNVSRPCPCLP